MPKSTKSADPKNLADAEAELVLLENERFQLSSQLKSSAKALNPSTKRLSFSFNISAKSKVKQIEAQLATLMGQISALKLYIKQELAAADKVKIEQQKDKITEAFSQIQQQYEKYVKDPISTVTMVNAIYKRIAETLTLVNESRLDQKQKANLKDSLDKYNKELARWENATSKALISRLHLALDNEFLQHLSNTITDLVKIHSEIVSSTPEENVSVKRTFITFFAQRLQLQISGWNNLLANIDISPHTYYSFLERISPIQIYDTRSPISRSKDSADSLPHYHVDENESPKVPPIINDLLHNYTSTLYSIKNKEYFIETASQVIKDLQSLIKFAKMFNESEASIKSFEDFINVINRTVIYVQEPNYTPETDSEDTSTSSGPHMRRHSTPG